MEYLAAAINLYTRSSRLITDLCPFVVTICASDSADALRRSKRLIDLGVLDSLREAAAEHNQHQGGREDCLTNIYLAFASVVDGQGMFPVLLVSFIRGGLNSRIHSTVLIFGFHSMISLAW